MSKPATVFKRCTNLLLQFLAENVAVGEMLPTEQYLTTICQGSRTAVRSAITYLNTRRLIASLAERRLLRKPIPGDYFDMAELQSGAERIQQVLMERVYQRDMPPGAEFSEAELAREAGASTVSVREFLIGFSRFGLIEKKPRGGWRLCAFDRSFATELADMRRMFELAAVEQFAALQHNDPAYKELARLIVQHEKLEAKIDTRHSAFPALDREFHTFLIGLLNNRFAQGFYDIVSFVFHYHYQWDKGEEMGRNKYALQEHLAILRALAVHDVPTALACMQEHLTSSRRTMLQSIGVREKAQAQG
ncbi:GntR family transcriptional regulator [Janthinobacterium sp. GB4P2]|uniref:GntR family transcriptional regulator n=1 Tax=Janthinobacterium sp. GB4P2 TaxID=3424189 RepID=UPI003F2212A2